MAATREEIRTWLEYAKERGATHLIVVCDAYDWDDYPVAVMPRENVRAKVVEYEGKDMQKVMEVYAMHLDFDVQLDQTRAFNLEGPPVEAS